jgi:two-component system, NtrC family, nitrogen regulation sensor histidine kinase NtrY
MATMILDALLPDPASVRRIGLFGFPARWVPALEAAILVWLAISLIISYFLLAHVAPGQTLLTPPLVGLAMVANLVPAIALLVLIGRRLARNRAQKLPGQGDGRLHVRLVGLFSLISAVPVLLLVIFASLLFQYGFDFWYSQKARGIFENANSLAQTYYREKQQNIISETEVMASDTNFNLDLAPISSERFVSSFGFQVFQRNLSEGAILRITKANGVQSLAIVNPYNRNTENLVAADVAEDLLAKRTTVFRDAGTRMEAITPIPGRPDLFLYTSRVDNSPALQQSKRFSRVLNDYNALLERSRTLQLAFQASLFVISLLVVGASVAIALNVADRLVKPIRELAFAAERVSDGDLSIRVADPGTDDEIGLLSSSFNGMTERLELQRRDLVGANDLLDRRRTLIEAVLSSVTAGVISVDASSNVRILNDRACAMLGKTAEQATGANLAIIGPELHAAILGGQGESIIELDGDDGKRTLAIKVVANAGGHVITFDDISQQLADQRHAAWSDVARRVAHEIKNPLTPIQLAAERLRRPARKGESLDPETAVRLTDTIVRQVGDIRRMVDEFSSFARMPKPVFALESLTDICKQAIFLQEVAHPDITFEFVAPGGEMSIVCDHRQLGQAMTNILKNAVEAVGARQEREPGAVRHITVSIDALHTGAALLTIADSGIGLPADRNSIVEPYVTTRSNGTGLGLAIVKRIAEEHGGALEFTDNPGGGTIVSMKLDAERKIVLPPSPDPENPDAISHQRNTIKAD